MERILQWNVRGLKVSSNSFFKIKKVVSNLENIQNTHIFNLQETHLQDDTEIPKKFKDFDHMYHILSTHATNVERGAGIILFINKTHLVIEQRVLHPGNLLYAQYI